MRGLGWLLAALGVVVGEHPGGVVGMRLVGGVGLLDVVVEGEADVFVDGSHSIAKPGCFYQIPAGTKHCYKIRSKSAKFVVVTSPAGARDFFVELDAVTGGSCEDMGKVVAVAVKHGFTV